MVDYSLYLVTDSTDAILGGRDLVSVVEQALEGGVTIVQYRDKTLDTSALISTAKALHQICQDHNIPLVINDRVDVALAVGCEGVHVGQDDMSVSAVRQILGPNKIVGASVSCIEEARIAVEQGADYLGIGTLYSTNTKKNSKSIIGINGVRKILHYLGTSGDEAERNVKTVCIGGINASNLQLVNHQLYANWHSKTIDGVAIVSAIMASSDPESAAKHMGQLWASHPAFSPQVTPDSVKSPSDELSSVKAFTLAAMDRVHNIRPMNHNMTNLVVQNFAASVALAIGAAPIMSTAGDEAADLAKLGGGLVINMGTPTQELLPSFRTAIQSYNAVGGPVVLDPVGAGATTLRKEALDYLMASGYFELIKGNEKEILAVARASGFRLDDSQMQQQRGVDSGAALFTLEQKAYIVQRIAARECNIVLMTGAVDVISDGTRTYSISNGIDLLGLVTGSGCTLGTTLAAYLAANRKEDRLYAAIAGILHFEIAAEMAVSKRFGPIGPGTFVSAFLDQLYLMRAAEGDKEWIDGAKVECIKDIEDFGLLREI